MNRVLALEGFALPQESMLSKTKGKETPKWVRRIEWLSNDFSIGKHCVLKNRQEFIKTAYGEGILLFLFFFK